MTTNFDYIDWTDTGISPEFQGMRRATVAARWPADRDLDWLRALLRELSHGDENLERWLATTAKSDEVWSLAAQADHTRRRLEKGTSAAAIAVVDFWLHARRTLEILCEVFNVAPTLARDPAEILATGEVPQSAVKQMLARARETNIEWTSVTRIEWLLKDAVQSVGLRSARPAEVFDREALHQMGEQEQREAVARFSLALGDAFDPDVMRRVIEEKWSRERFFTPGWVSIETLLYAVAQDRMFDQGKIAAFTAVANAHDRIVDRLEESCFQHLQTSVVQGRLCEGKSEEVFGIRAADLAAYRARDIYEQFPEDRPEGARALARAFHRVLLNDDWIE